MEIGHNFNANPLESIFSLKRHAFHTIRLSVLRKKHGSPLTLGRAGLCRRLAFYLFKDNVL